MKTVYADYNATSPLEPSHLKHVLDRLGTRILGNASSQHQPGRDAKVLLSTARRFVAKAMGVDVDTLVFVSGGSEANNAATAGVVWDRSHTTPIHQQHAIVSAIEHPSVQEPLSFLKKNYGLQITEILPQPNGVVKTQDILNAITPHTTLIALMAANNETGALQPVQELGNAIQRLRWPSSKVVQGGEWASQVNPQVTAAQLQNLHVHIDAVQAFGKIPAAQWRSDGQDSVAVCAHKIGGLAGIGALSIKRGYTLRPTIVGGPQERNRRAGTESLIGVVSLGVLSEEMEKPQWWSQWQSVDELKNQLAKKIGGYYPHHQVLNNTPNDALPNTLSFSLGHTDDSSEIVLMELDMRGIYASSGSACSSGVRLPSPVLKAMGRSDHEVLNGLRFSFGRQTQKEDIDLIFQNLTEVLPRKD